jgi:hypothetical protein
MPGLTGETALSISVDWLATAIRHLFSCFPSATSENPTLPYRFVGASAPLGSASKLGHQHVMHSPKAAASSENSPCGGIAVLVGPSLIVKSYGSEENPELLMFRRGKSLREAPNVAKLQRALDSTSPAFPPKPRSFPPRPGPQCVSPRTRAPLTWLLIETDCGNRGSWCSTVRLESTFAWSFEWSFLSVKSTISTQAPLFLAMGAVYDEVELEDCEFDKSLKAFFYPCPCGDRFTISLVRARRCSAAFRDFGHVFCVCRAPCSMAKTLRAAPAALSRFASSMTTRTWSSTTTKTMMRLPPLLLPPEQGNASVPAQSGIVSLPVSLNSVVLLLLEQ